MSRCVRSSKPIVRIRQRSSSKTAASWGWSLLTCALLGTGCTSLGDEAAVELTVTSAKSYEVLPSGAMPTRDRFLYVRARIHNAGLSGAASLTPLLFGVETAEGVITVASGLGTGRAADPAPCAADMAVAPGHEVECTLIFDMTRADAEVVTYTPDEDHVAAAQVPFVPADYPIDKSLRLLDLSDEDFGRLCENAVRHWLPSACERDGAVFQPIRETPLDWCWSGHYPLWKEQADNSCTAYQNVADCRVRDFYSCFYNLEADLCAIETECRWECVTPVSYDCP